MDAGRSLLVPHPPRRAGHAPISKRRRRAESRPRAVSCGPDGRALRARVRTRPGTLPEIFVVFVRLERPVLGVEMQKHGAGEGRGGVGEGSAHRDGGSSHRRRVLAASRGHLARLRRRWRSPRSRRASFSPRDGRGRAIQVSHGFDELAVSFGDSFRRLRVAKMKNFRELVRDGVGVVDDGSDIEALVRARTSGGVLVELTGRVPARCTVAQRESAPSSEVRSASASRRVAPRNRRGGFVGSRVRGAGERGGERARGSRNANAGGVFAEARILGRGWAAR